MLNSHTLDTIKERNKKEVTMDYKIKGDSDCPIVEINLQNNETVKIERGSMAYMSNVVIEGKMNSNIVYQNLLIIYVMRRKIL